MTQNDFFMKDEEIDTPQNCVSVLVPFPVDKAYSYTVPSSLNIGIGDYVRVPFKGRDVNGVVWDTHKNVSKKLKPVLYKHNVCPLPADHRKLIEWTARYTATPLGSVLKMTLSTQKAFEEEKPVIGYRLSVSDNI